MSIEFEALVIDGFMPFVGRHEIELGNQGLVFVVGENRVSKMASSNGTGKTAIFDSWSMVHYDRMLRGTVGTRLINRQSKTMAIESYFTVNKQAYCAKREQTGKSRSWDLYELHGETRTLLGGGERIEKLFGLSFRGAQNTLLFGVSEKPFFAGQSDVPRKQLFDEILDLSFFGEKKKREEEKVKLVLDARGTVEGRLKEIEASHASLLIEQSALLAQEHAMHTTQLSASFAMADEQRTLYGELNLLVGEYLRAYEERAIEQALVDDSTQLAALRNRIGHKLDGIEQQLARLELQRDETLERGACPVCLRPTTGAQDEITGYFQSAMQPLRLSREEWIVHERIMAMALKYWPTLDPAAHYESLRERCVKLLEHIKTRPWQTELQEERYLRQSIDGIGERIGSLETERTKLESELGIISAEQALKEFTVEMLGHKGLKAMILRKYDTFIADRLRTYGEILTAGELELIFHSYRTLKSGELRDEITFEVNNIYGADCYDDLSSGEKQRVDLCLVLALQDVVRDLHKGHFSLALYDEIFEHFDESGCEQVMDFLTQHRRAIGSVFVISHNPRLLAYPSDKVIRVVKTKKGSTIHVE